MNRESSKNCLYLKIKIVQLIVSLNSVRVRARNKLIFFFVILGLNGQNKGVGFTWCSVWFGMVWYGFGYEIKWKNIIIFFQKSK